MAITYSWTIEQLQTFSNDENTGIVYVASYLFSGTDGQYGGGVYGSESIAYTPNDPNFIPYANLTEAEVLTWVQTALGANKISEMQNDIDLQIQNQINPLPVPSPLPWIK